MKFPTLLLAVSGALAIPQGQQNGAIARRAHILCGRAENIDMSKCKTETEKCIKDRLEEKKLDSVPSPADSVFWYYVRQCGLAKQTGSDNLTPRNFVALYGSVFTTIDSCKVEEGKFSCDGWQRTNPGSCSIKDKNCYPMSVLPDLCANEGVCKNCSYGFAKNSLMSPSPIQCEMEK